MCKMTIQMSQEETSENRQRLPAGAACVKIAPMPLKTTSQTPDSAKVANMGLAGDCSACCPHLAFSIGVEDAGIAICHSQGYIISILQGPEMELREWTRCVDTQKNIKSYQKNSFSYGKIY